MRKSKRNAYSKEGNAYCVWKNDLLRTKEEDLIWIATFQEDKQESSKTREEIAEKI